MKRILRPLFIILIGIQLLFGQEVLISGKIRDINTHEEIPAVSIYIKGTQIGTSSSFTGQYLLQVPDPEAEMIVMFQHIAYDLREIPIGEVKLLENIYLQPRIIPLQELEIEGKGKPFEIDKDLPQTFSLLDARNFEIRGFVDAGDLLRTNHSIQVEEQLSGKKTVAIRAGNPDEVAVLYNGVRMNSSYNNIFDLSLVDLEDLDRFEIIKGSNTALYGSDAFSGVINIVPKMQYNYNARFHQRVGTYRSGYWGLNLYQQWNRLHGSMSFKRGAAQRRFLGETNNNFRLANTTSHETTNLVYNFSEDSHGRPRNLLSIIYSHSILDYENQRDGESLANSNRVVLVRYDGDIGTITDMILSVSHHGFNESQIMLGNFGSLIRKLRDRTLQFNLEKQFKFNYTELLLAYQFEDAELDFHDDRGDLASQSFGLESATFSRQHQGFVSIVKFHSPSNSDVIEATDLDISFRRDWVIDRQHNPVLRQPKNTTSSNLTAGLFDDKLWNGQMVKLSTRFSGARNNIYFDVYMNYGTNIKFPTLLQQISSPYSLNTDEAGPNLNLERNTSVEIAVVLRGEAREQSSLYGYQLSGGAFRNFYENKFRLTFPLGIPVVFYDNVPNAKLSGFESKSSLFFFRKKVTFEMGFSRYFVSEKAAFPFKSETKLTSDLIVHHAGYSLNLHWFREGEQVGLVRTTAGGFSEIILPDYANIDFHLGKNFEYGKLKFFANVSARNLVKDNVVLEGLALRDRRLYLTMGAQY